MAAAWCKQRYVANWGTKSEHTQVFVKLLKLHMAFVPYPYPPILPCPAQCCYHVPQNRGRRWHCCPVLRYVIILHCNGEWLVCRQIKWSLCFVIWVSWWSTVIWPARQESDRVQQSTGIGQKENGSCFLFIHRNASFQVATSHATWHSWHKLRTSAFKLTSYI